MQRDKESVAAMMREKQKAGKGPRSRSSDDLAAGGVV